MQSEQVFCSSRLTRSSTGSVKRTNALEQLGVKRTINLVDNTVSLKRSCNKIIVRADESDGLLNGIATSSKQRHSSSAFSPTVVLEKVNIAEYLTNRTVDDCRSVTDSDKNSDCNNGANSYLDGSLFNTVNEQVNLTPNKKRSEQNGCQKVDRKRSLHCPRCKQRSFSQQFELDTHLACHNDSNDGYHCPVCEYRHDSWSRVLAHLLVHPNMCERLRDAESVRNIVGTFPCEECGRVFDKKQSMKYHVAKVHSRADRTCESCNVTFANITQKAFCLHYDSCAGLEHRCEQCTFTTRSSFEYHTHVALHGKQAAKCEVCDAVFPTAQRLKQHSVVHCNDRPLRLCEHCGKAFKSNDAVQKHVVRFHSDNDRPWPCSQCSYRAKLEVDLKKHTSLVHDKKFKCTQCPYSTNYHSQLDDHMSRHDLDSSLPCDWHDCYFRASTAAELESHLSSVHNSTSKHVCPICQKRFRKRTNLMRHLLAHTGGRPYSCGDCAATFASHSTYYRHRQRTGHDLHRHGGAALPQSIVVHVMSELEQHAGDDVVDSFDNGGDTVGSLELSGEYAIEHGGNGVDGLDHGSDVGGLDHPDDTVGDMVLDQTDDVVVGLD